MAMLNYDGEGLGSEMALLQDASGTWLVRENTSRLISELM